jgi:uncharacterized membrane protein
MLSAAASRVPPVFLADIGLFELSLFLHITAVVVGFGATFAESVFFPVAMNLDQRHLPYVHRVQLTINRFLATPALVIVLLTGFYQAAERDYSMGEAWLSASLAIVIVLGGLIGAYFVPSDRRLGALAEREIAAAGPGGVRLSDEYQSGARKQGAFGALAGVLIIVAVFLMVTKPGA